MLVLYSMPGERHPSQGQEGLSLASRRAVQTLGTRDTSEGADSPVTCGNEALRPALPVLTGVRLRMWCRLSMPCSQQKRPAVPTIGGKHSACTRSYRCRRTTFVCGSERSGRPIKARPWLVFLRPIRRVSSQINAGAPIPCLRALPVAWGLSVLLSPAA